MQSKKIKRSIVKQSITNKIENIPAPWDGDVAIEVRYSISLDDSVDFVNMLVGACVDEETGDYTPEFFSFVLGTEILTKYTNLALPTSFQDQYSVVYGMFDTVNIVREHINQEQLQDIISSAKRKIDYKLSMMNNVASHAIEEASLKISNVAELLETSFAGISPAETKKLVSAVSSMKKLDEAKVAEAIILSKADAKDQ